MNGKRFLSLVLTMCMVLSMLPANVLAIEWPVRQADSADAPELVNGYYEIYTADNLYWFASQVNGGSTSINAKLMADIVVNENVLKADGTLNGDGSNFRTWMPIGDSANRYWGSFVGNGKTISGLYINTDENGVGLFGYTGEAILYNITVVDSYIRGGNYVGGIVGYNDNGFIQSCTNAATVDGTGSVGGIIGYSDNHFSGIILPEDCFCEDIRCSICNPCFYDVRNCYSVGRVNGSGIIGEFDFKYLDAIKSTYCYYLEGSASGGVEGQDIVNVAEPKAASFFPAEILPAWAGVAPQLVDGYYEIYNADQLYWFAEKVNGGDTAINGKLMADIVVNENVLNEDGELNGDGSNFRVWTPICNSSKKYTGTFDGNGKTISGLYFNDTSKSYVGLFGRVGSGGVVENVGVVDSYIRGDNYVGGVVGYHYSGTVSNSYNTGSVSGSSYVGGVSGFNTGTVSNSYNTGSVSGSEDVGGVTGFNTGTVSNSYNNGSVSGGTGAGGVVGLIGYGGSVSDCYNTGSISGYENVGGVVGCGYNYNNSVSRCYNTGSVSGSEDVGGVVGLNSDGTISNCYNTGSVSGDDDVSGVVGYNSGTVSKCYNTGSVSGSWYVGGVVSYNSSGTVSNSYNTGSVSGSDYVGGVVGYNIGSVSNSYNTGSVSGSSYYVGGVVGYHDSTSGTVTNCYYRTGCAKDGDNEIQFGIGCETQGSNARDTAGVTIGKSTDAFASGEVAYMLQGEQTEHIWGQNIGMDAYPVLGGDRVYYDDGVYTNQIPCLHSWSEATCIAPKTCTICGVTEGYLRSHVCDWVVTVAPTCTEPGLDTYACAICGYIQDTYEISPIGHYFQNEVTSLPTCTEYGIVTHTCTRCGYSYTDSVMTDLHTVFEDSLRDFDLFDQEPLDTIFLTLNTKLNPMYHIGCDGSDNCYKTMSAEEFEAELDRYIAINDAILNQARFVFGYDPQTQTYRFSHIGGWGGAIYSRECLGYIKNGNTYSVFFEDRVLEPLPQEGYDYLEALGNYPERFTFEGKVYEDFCWGEYYHVVSYTGTGNRYEVEYDGNTVRILSWSTYGPEDKPEEFDHGVYPDLNPIDHIWTEEATCTTPRYCINCGLTNGTTLAHDEAVTPGYAATYDAPGLTDGSYCSRCGETVQEQQPIAPIAEEVTFSYKACGINGSANAVNSGYVTLEIWMNINSDMARLWAADLSLSFNENLTLLEISGGIFAESLATPLDIANAYHAVKLTQDMGYGYDKTFSKGQYLFATLTFKVDRDFCAENADFVIGQGECLIIRKGMYSNDLVSDFGTGTSIYVSKLGDADLDGRITAADTMALSMWFEGADLDAYEAIFDLNKDGYVDGDDFALLRGAVVWDDSYLDI